MHGRNGTSSLQEATVDFWLGLGVHREFINMGVPLYGRGFTVYDPSEGTDIYSDAFAPSLEGPYTRIPGTLGYNEVQSVPLESRRLRQASS